MSAAAPANSPPASPSAAPATTPPAAPAPPASAPEVKVVEVSAPPPAAAPTPPVPAAPEPPSPTSSVVFVEKATPVKEAAPLPPPASPVVTKAPTAIKGTSLTKTMAEVAPVTVIETTKPADEPKPKPADTTVIVTEDAKTKADIKAAEKDVKAEDKAAKKEEKVIKREEKRIEKEEKKIEKDLAKAPTIVVVTPEASSKPSVVVVDKPITATVKKPSFLVLESPLPQKLTAPEIENVKSKPGKTSTYELVDVAVQYRRRDRIRIKIEQLLEKLFGSSQEKHVDNHPYRRIERPFKREVKREVKRDEAVIANDIHSLQAHFELKEQEFRIVKHRYMMALRAELKKAELSTERHAHDISVTTRTKLHEARDSVERRGRTRERVTYQDQAEADVLREEASQRRAMKVGGHKLADLKARLEDMEETEVVEVEVS